uniref:Uncharacterized protein n=1 Tax=Arion vulgaris TaxID=1028688 RepID=A0A0B7AEI2_9EUPU
MRMASSAVLRIVMVFALAMPLELHLASGQKTIVKTTVLSTRASTVPTPAATTVFNTSQTASTTSTLIETAMSTSAASYPITGTTITPYSTLSAQLSTSANYSTSSTSATQSTIFSPNQTVNTVESFQTSVTIQSSTTLVIIPSFYSTIVTDQQNNSETFLPSKSSETASENSTTFIVSQSEDFDNTFSSDVIDVLSTQEVQPTSVLTSYVSPTSSQSIISPTSTTVMTTTMTTTTQKSSPTVPNRDNGKGDSPGGLSDGAKVAIGIIVALCVLGLIIAGVVFYRRYNFTHRSLKSFLTSGVRYKTYNNATYKDDEGMLIMPDRR